MKPFTCEFCGQAFARRERLKHHLERNHQGAPMPSGVAASTSAGNAGSVMESHHSNMASPHVVAPSPHPQNLVIPSVISSHEHLLHQHQGQQQLQDEQVCRVRHNLVPGVLLCAEQILKRGFTYTRGPLTSHQKCLIFIITFPFLLSLQVFSTVGI